MEGVIGPCQKWITNLTGSLLALHNGADGGNSGVVIDSPSLRLRRISQDYPQRQAFVAEEVTSEE